MGKQTRGFVVADAVIGMAIVVTMATMLVVAVNKQHKFSQNLTEQRAAMRQIENVMIRLQTSQGTSDPALDASASIVILPDAAPVPGHAWLRISRPVGRADVTLVALVRRDLADRLIASRQGKHGGPDK